MAAIKRASSMISMSMEQRSSNAMFHNHNLHHHAEEEEEQNRQQQRWMGRRRKLSHSRRVRFSEKEPTIHPPNAAYLRSNVEEEGGRLELVQLWYSRDDIQQFLVERSHLAMFLMNLNGSVPLSSLQQENDDVDHETGTNKGLCLRGFEQYFSTAVRQQILARRIEHRTMVLMEQFRQRIEMGAGQRDPCLLRACIQHISKPATEEALLIAALDMRAIAQDLAMCRLFFPVQQQQQRVQLTTGNNNTVLLSSSLSRDHHHLHRRVTPSPSFTLQKSLSSDSNVLMTSTTITTTSKDCYDHQQNCEWLEATTTTTNLENNNSKLAPISTSSSISSATSSSSSTIVGNPVVLTLPNDPTVPKSLNLRLFIG